MRNAERGTVTHDGITICSSHAQNRKDKDMAGFSEPVVRLRVNQRLKHKTRKTRLDNADPTLRNPALLRAMALT